MLANFHSNITLLITHYNRPHSLMRLLERLNALNLSFAEIIVSDDGSQAGNLKELYELQKEYNYKLLPAPENKGLGNNINKGQDKVNTEFTLYLQEDFIPTPEFREVLMNSVELFQEDPELDLIRYFSQVIYPYTKTYKKNFLQMYIPPFAMQYHKIHMYSDTPHLRRTSFFSKFGRYRENIPSDRMEYWMCVSFIQNKGKCLISTASNTLFLHVNFSEEPSTINRVMWKQKNNFLIRFLRNTYRQLKYNYDLNFAG